MNVFVKATVAGVSGAVTTTLLHEFTRRVAPDAPRVDLLGMQALARALGAVGIRPPAGDALYNLTLAGDLVSNSGYFALVGVGSRDNAMVAGAALGVAAGLGAVYLPKPLGLSAGPTKRTGQTRALTVALYAAGGIAAGAVYRALPASHQ